MKAAIRNKLPKSKFALPTERKYPVNDAAHAKNAKARATQMEKRGIISSSTKTKIDSKANKVLSGMHGKMADGGRVATATDPYSMAHKKSG